MYVIKQSVDFSLWLSQLRDKQAKAIIVDRIKRAIKGNFGDHKNLGGGLYEMRIHFGKGYRIYYTQIEDVVYLLLNAGSKSGQQHDIQNARTMISYLEKEE